METATKEKTTSRACGKCQYWQPKDGDEGECRRYAPRSVAFNVDQATRYETHFPETASSDWCGDYAPR